MTIGEASKKFEISTDTLRYYERIGLIPPVPRNKSGLRDYNEDSCNWINFIKCMRSAGMPIEALIEYVQLFQMGDSTIEARKSLLVEQLKNLEVKRDNIQHTIDRLNIKIQHYDDIILRCENSLNGTSFKEQD
ncbi:MAG: MerR family transcriptional regulator [Ruminococcus sp.]|nr:MerR family transcriptional regulator [Ruminococcus sp.]